MALVMEIKYPSPSTKQDESDDKIRTIVSTIEVHDGTITSKQPIVANAIGLDFFPFLLSFMQTQDLEHFGLFSFLKMLAFDIFVVEFNYILTFAKQPTQVQQLPNNLVPMHSNTLQPQAFDNELFALTMAFIATNTYENIQDTIMGNHYQKLLLKITTGNYHWESLLKTTIEDYYWKLLLEITTEILLMIFKVYFFRPKFLLIRLTLDKDFQI